MMGHFAQGFLVSIILISLLLGSQYGLHFYFLSDDGLTILPTFGTALNWRTAIIVSLVYLIIDRNEGPYLLPIFAWSIFDTLWIFKHSMTGSFLFGSIILTFPMFRGQVIGYGRNLILMIMSKSSVKQMKISRISMLFFMFTCLYWGYLLMPIFLSLPPGTYPKKYYLFTPLVYYVINFAPFIVSFKEMKGKTWKKFLFY